MATGPVPAASRLIASLSPAGESTGAGVPSRGAVNGTGTSENCTVWGKPLAQVEGCAGVVM